MPAPDLETIVSLAKRRGFVYPAAEIYGGFANTYDYGPLGVELKRNIREAWWRAMVRERDDVVEPCLDLVRTKPQDGGVEGDILTAREFGIEASAKLQQRCNTTRYLNLPLCRRQGSTDQLQQRGFAGAIVADDPDSFARSDVETYAAQSPMFAIELLAPVSRQTVGNHLSQPIAWRFVQMVALAHAA